MISFSDKLYIKKIIKLEHLSSIISFIKKNDPSILYQNIDDNKSLLRLIYENYSFHNLKEIISILNIDKNKLDTNGIALVHMCMLNHDMDTIKKLELDTNIPDSSGRTPLMLSLITEASKEFYMDAINYTISNGYDMETKSKKGEKAINVAQRFDNNNFKETINNLNF